MAVTLIRNKFEMIAYRGGGGERPENPIAALEHALSINLEGCARIEHLAHRLMKSAGAY
jgi:glycerophosphoryl diester phosphodiesterase